MVAVRRRSADMTPGPVPHGPTFPATIADGPTVVDLFSGAGGTGLGFRLAGFRICGAVELNGSAAATYTWNLGVRVRVEDIRNLPADTYRDELGMRRGELDVLVGCPPCQGFSRIRNRHGAGDARNTLVLKYLEYLEAFMPRFAVFENVPGLIYSEHGKRFYEQLLEGVARLGYAHEEHKIDAANFGVAQHRQRIIVVLGREEQHLPFPQATHEWQSNREVEGGNLLPVLTVRRRIAHYPALQAGQNGESQGRFPNHIAAATGDKVLGFIRAVPHNGGSRRDIPRERWLDCHEAHDGHYDVYGRMVWDEPSNTITGGCTNPSKGRFVHPEQDRAITPREAAALQGFPEAFRFCGFGVADQIGNAVPPPLAHLIALELRRRLRADEPMPRAHILFPEDNPNTAEREADR